MNTSRIPAHQLQIGQVVIADAGPPRRVGSCRIEGARPTVVVAWVDSPTRSVFPAVELLTVADDHQL